ncbi:MAG TPA: SBBP repeat-containing protein, partial [Chloroflexota bacterium]|nr:SBBP repeat-containing protein [Chloroflexota bacterium]
MDSSGDYAWVAVFDASQGDAALGVAVDSSDNVYVTGYFEDTVDFDPGSGTNNHTSSHPNLFDVFVLKLGSSGDLVWAKSFGGSSNNERGRAIAVDSSGNVYVTGEFHATADFDPGDDTAELTPVDGTNGYALKLDSSGDYVWAKQFGLADGGESIAVDSSGNVYTTGTFTGTADFDPGDDTAELTSGAYNSKDPYVLKLDSSGNYLWVKSFVCDSSCYSESIAVDSSGNVYTTGAFRNTVDFDPGVGTAELTATDDIDVYVSKLDSSGNYEWVRHFPGSVVSYGYYANDHGQSIAVDSSGNVYTTGYFSHTVDFDPGVGTAELTANETNSYLDDSDVYVSKLDSSGNYVWAKSFGGTSDDQGLAVAVDSSGNVYTTGFFQSTADFDPGAGTTNLTSNGLNDAFVSRLDSTGNLGTVVPAGFTLSTTSVSVAETGTTAQFTVVLDAEPVSDVVIWSASSDSGEAQVGGGAGIGLTFT